MPRAIRQHAPDSGVHVTARLRGGAPFFTDAMRDDVADILCEAAAACNAPVLALVIMPDHFHVVVKQSSFPLGWMMQRAMQRIAHRVKRMHGLEGHIFGRRYWSSVCSGPDYLRSAILYTNLNPHAARLCTDPIAYAWNTHSLYLDVAPRSSWQAKIAAEEGRLLFAHDSLDRTEVTRRYAAFAAFVIARRAEVSAESIYCDVAGDTVAPRTHLGDGYWAKTYSHAVIATRPRIERVDLRDRAIAALRKIDKACTLDLIRHAGRNRTLCRIRRQLIATLVLRGCRGAAIARCLRVSPSVVSAVSRSLRAPQ